MKIQYLAVIFVVIIIPISIVMSQYIQTQIDTITLQTAYNKNLNDATYDAMKAFQINSINNKYSSVSDSKIRDIEASINTFYNSLGISMDSYVSSEEQLSGFIPAILFNLYDGYYIYSLYENKYTQIIDDNGTPEKSDDELDYVVIPDVGDYETGLHPYIYYSAEYVLGTDTVVVNYTLDNEITVYGELKNESGAKEYLTKSGYLINPNAVQNINDDAKTLTYNGIEIGPEELKEHLIVINEDSREVTEADYKYIVFNNQKVYQDLDEHGNLIYVSIQVPKYSASGSFEGYITLNNVPKLFWYDEYKKKYLQGETANVYSQYFGIDLIKVANGEEPYSTNARNKMTEFKSTSAYDYYLEAQEFSDWVVNTSGLKSIDQTDLVNAAEIQELIDTGTEGIFDTTAPGNDPLVSGSVFNSHREAIIRNSIQTNLAAAIANYANHNDFTNFDFALPKIDEESWYQITNNISIISFMQGMPIGMKYYNNYSVVTSTKNEEVINAQTIYIVAEDSSGNREYHQPGCKQLIDNVIAGSVTNLEAYNILSFQRQTAQVPDWDPRYFYPQSRITSAGVKKKITGCYNCIVNATADYNVDGIIQGSIKKNDDEDEELYNGAQISAIRQIYLQALARERYDLYKSNFDLNS